MFNIFKKTQKDETLKEQLDDLLKFPIDVSNESIYGLNCDILPDASGKFGKEITNPIPVNGPVGEIKYLNRLRYQDGVGFMYHRLGAKDEIDIYEIVSLDGKVWDILYFDMYHPRRSTKTPAGYSFSKFHPIFSRFPFGFGTNSYDSNFPYGLGKFIEKEVNLDMDGNGTFKRKMLENYEKFIEDKNKFIRPEEHIKKLSLVEMTSRLS